MSSHARSILITVVFALAGVFVGLGAYTFYYAKGASYLSDDPNACANCHIMRDQLASWQKSSHHKAATCNSCHTPHDVIGKYATKLENGYHHSRAFTFQDWHEPIRMRDVSAQIVLTNCTDCHKQFVSQLPAHVSEPDASVNCITCHRDAGHAGK